MFSSFAFFDLLEQNLAERAAHPALVDGERHLSYGELHQYAEALAGWLYAQGVRAGDRVGIYLPTCFEQAIAMFAAARIGAVFVNLSDQWPVSQFEHYANDCAMKVLVTDSKRALELAARMLPASLTHVLVVGEAPEHARMLSWSRSANHRPAPSHRAIDVALATIVYTSGSTGLPKGVMLSHRSLLHMARVSVRQFDNTASDRILHGAPFAFTYGLAQLVTMFLAGATLILQRASMTSLLVKLLVDQRATGFAGVPAAWMHLVNYLREQPTAFPDLRYLANSGGGIPRTAAEALPRLFPGVAIHQMYGSTEAFRSACVPPEKFLEKMGAIGIANLNTEVYLINDHGICGPGEEGELVSRGSGISMGYWGQPEATAEKIKPCPQLRHLIGDEKVYYSGDIMRIDADGYLWYIGRNDALIKSNAVRISPAEVEDVISRSNMVGDVVAFGVADALRGQVVHAALTPRAGGAVDLTELERYCRRQMPSYMVPAKFHHWAGDMPRTASGKLDRVSVIERFGGATK